MIIPWGTDAPIYHRPWATIGLIVFTALVFVVTGPAELVDEDRVGEPQSQVLFGESSPWVLSHGRGLHPTQWLASNFAHANLWHLLGNMIFLWGFGIVVEGKIGWWPFLLLYLGLGIAQCASEQLLFLGAAGGVSFGASAVIYGLMAMCLVWAPRNDLCCLVIWRRSFFTPQEVEIPILAFAAVYLAVQAVIVLLSGLKPNSALYHLSGALWGFAAATVMLKTRWVDCEGWDLFSCMRGTHIRGKPKAAELLKERAIEELEQAEELKAAAQGEAEGGSTTLLGNLRQAIAQGHAPAALALYEKLEQGRGTWEPPELDLLRLIELLHTHRQRSRSIPLMEQYLHRFPRAEAAPRMRLRLAQLLLEAGHPAQALRVLAEMPPAALGNPHVQQARQQLEQTARAMCEARPGPGQG